MLTIAHTVWLWTAPLWTVPLWTVPSMDSSSMDSWWTVPSVDSSLYGQLTLPLWTVDALWTVHSMDSWHSLYGQFALWTVRSIDSFALWTVDALWTVRSMDSSLVDSWRFVDSSLYGQSFPLSPYSSYRSTCKLFNLFFFISPNYFLVLLNDSARSLAKNEDEKFSSEIESTYQVVKLSNML
jgi:hypothetical protein